MSLLADLLVNNLSRSPWDADSDTDDLSTLPFPEPLSRPLFSAPDFSTEAFLLAHSKFRTLDDLRTELRSWVEKLENEMELLIGEDWQGYLSLGRGLMGSEQTVKDAAKRVQHVERELQVSRSRSLY